MKSAAGAVLGFVRGYAKVSFCANQSVAADGAVGQTAAPAAVLQIAVQFVVVWTQVLVPLQFV